MKNFKAIMYKDFVTIGDFSWITYGIILLIGSISAFLGNLHFYFFLFFFIYMEQSVSVLWADDSQGWTKYSQSLMMSRKSIVNIKYIHLLISWLFGIGLIELCFVIGNIIRGEKVFDFNNLFIFSVSIIILCVNAIAVSLMFFGHKFIAFFFISGSAGFIGGYYGGEMGEVKSFSIQRFNEIDEELRFVFEKSFHFEVIAVCAVVILAVWIFTLILYQRKDF